uniref:Uncharacterized protein n=1 Tax=Treponema phagedenis TaxID=162 RepID=A0A191VM66_TREPH|nr:hypothetical protein [Treponema phagedenis]
MVVNVFYFCIARKAFFTKRQRTCPIFSAQINSLIPPPPTHTHDKSLSIQFRFNIYFTKEREISIFELVLIFCCFYFGFKAQSCFCKKTSLGFLRFKNARIFL